MAEFLIFMGVKKFSFYVGTFRFKRGDKKQSVLRIALACTSFFYIFADSISKLCLRFQFLTTKIAFSTSFAFFSVYENGRVSFFYTSKMTPCTLIKRLTRTNYLMKNTQNYSVFAQNVAIKNVVQSLSFFFGKKPPCIHLSIS